MNNPECSDYGKLIILFQVKPDPYFRGKFLIIKDKEVMYGTNDYEKFKFSLKKSVNSYAYDLIIIQPIDLNVGGTYPIFDDDARRRAGKGGGRGYTFNLYLYNQEEYDNWVDTFKMDIISILIHNITFLSTGRSEYIISIVRLISFSYFITEFTLSLKKNKLVPYMFHCKMEIFSNKC